jgi:hypothetical protein
MLLIGIANIDQQGKVRCTADVANKKFIKSGCVEDSDMCINNVRYCTPCHFLDKNNKSVMIVKA